MAQWFETKVRFDKTLENGTVKKVTESYLVDALSFTEAEARTTEEVLPYISGEHAISVVKKCKISEIFYDSTGDKWYKVKVAFISVNEKTGQEKKTYSYILVQASDFKSAYDNFIDGMKGTMADFEIAGITETAILDVFKVKLNDQAKE